jgi:hypothetical protein
MFVLSLALAALLGLVAPPHIFAQATAPQPKFAITGFIDNVGTWTQNISTFDFNVNRNRDHQFYGRTRGRFDIIGEVGQAKGVFGFEVDAYWGQTGFIDSNMGPGCVTSGATSAVTCGAVGTGAESSFDLNTDTQGSVTVKWLYAEFPLPLVPFATIVRLGAQPLATAATFKLATYAQGDFAGVNLYSTFGPTYKLQMTYVAIDENLLGTGAFGPFIPFSGTLQNKCITANSGFVNGAIVPAGTVTANCTPQSRGDNFAFIGSPEITVMKDLDIKPMFSHVSLTGPTNVNTRTPRGGVSLLSGGPFAPTASANASGSPGVAGADGAGTGVHEYRNTVGVDARWRSGPWSVEPTFLYQFGTQAKWLQSFTGPTGPGPNPYGQSGTRASADISAWFGDVRGSYQLGSLLLSAMTMWTTGQDAKSNPYKSIKYYQPLDTNTTYLADWGTQIMSLGVDYYQILGNTGASNPGSAIGWDKYGRISSGVRVSYAWTPSLTVGAGVMPNWTWSKVDTDAFVVAGAGLQPSFVCRKTGQNCRPQGESNYLGTEWNLSLTYRFAPGLVFDWAFGYMMAGSALSHRYVASDYNAGAGAPVRKDIGVQDIAISTARVRFSF